MTLDPRALALLVEAVDAEVAADTVAAAPAAVVRSLGLGVRRRGPLVVTWAAGADVLAFNRALMFGVGAPARPADLDAVLDDYRAAAVPRCMLQVSPEAEPRALHGWLLERGLHHHNNWVKLYRRAEPLPAPAGAVRTEPVDARHAVDFGEIVGEAFGYPPQVREWAAAVVGRPGWRHYLAWDDDGPFATGALFVHGRVGWLGWAGTRSDRRERGGQCALIARRVSDAAALGCEWVVVETAEPKPERPAPSYRNMLRLGFTVAYLRHNFVRGGKTASGPGEDASRRPG